MVGIREVAERAGVSTGTVSKVLNRPQTVPAHTRQRVQHVIDELGYIRNASAHQLRAGSSRTIGLLIQDIANPFFTEVARGVEQAASAAGSIVILCNTELSPEREQQYLRTLEEQRVQGVLIFPTQADITHLERLRQRGTAVVVLDRPSSQVDLNWMVADDLRGGEMAAGHLFDLGHKQVVVIGGPQTIHQCAERVRGAQQAAQAHRRDPKRDVIHIVTSPSHSIHQGELCAEQILQIVPRPTAVFCVNDLLALGLMSVLLRRGVRVPSDMAIVGYDDIELAHAFAPALTTIRQPKAELGRAATRLLLAEAQNLDGHRQQIVYLPELIVREST